MNETIYGLYNACQNTGYYLNLAIFKLLPKRTPKLSLALLIALNSAFYLYMFKQALLVDHFKLRVLLGMGIFATAYFSILGLLEIELVTFGKLRIKFIKHV